MSGVIHRESSQQLLIEFYQHLSNSFAHPLHCRIIKFEFFMGQDYLQVVLVDYLQLSISGIVNK